MKLALKITAAAAVAVGLVLGTSGCSPTSPDGACRVDSKDRTTTTDGKSVYRVYTSCGVFNVEDAPFLGRYNSADTYARLTPGRSYVLETYGYRNGFLSTFPNIVDATEVTP